MLSFALFDQPVAVSDRTIFQVLIGFVVAEAIYITTLHASKASEIKKIYEERISELKGQTELVETLIDELDRERKLREGKPPAPPPKGG